MKKSIIVLVLLLAVACKSLPPVEPASEKSSAVAIQVEFEQLLSFMGNNPAEHVFFIRVENGNLMSKAGLIQATWTKKNRAYIFNADPGEYAAVAGDYTVTTQGQTTSTTTGNVTVSTTSGGGTNTYTTFFPKSMVESTRVKVEPGKLAYMGKYVLKMKQGVETADDVQKFYAEIIYPGSTKPASGLSAMFRQTGYTGTVSSSESGTDGRPAFLNLAREDFGETKWAGFAAQ